MCLLAVLALAAVGLARADSISAPPMHWSGETPSYQHSAAMNTQLAISTPATSWNVRKRWMPCAIVP